MKLRIVIPVLNEGEQLGPRLRALQAMRARGAELVVVDGGSTDSTWAVARTLADRVWVAPRGRASQMNRGALSSDADVLLFLHADTQLPDDADRLIANALHSGADWGRFDVQIDGQHPMLKVIAHMMNWRSRWTGIATGDQAIFVRQSVFEALGGFDQLPLMEDIALCRRLRSRSAPACLRAQVRTSGRRWDNHGLWRTIWLMWRLRLAYALGADPQQLARQYGYTPAPAPGRAALAIMAKAPIAGFAKTRLIPLLGPEGAAQAQHRFIQDSVATGLAARLGPVRLCCAPTTGHPLFQTLSGPGNLQVVPQVEGDLGQRMAHVFEQHFADPAALPQLLMGTDCPLLSPGHLQAAARALDQHDAVLIPAEDGGYVLIGMNRALPSVFDGVAWSTASVLAQTRARFKQLGLSWLELPPLWDVDSPDDWRRLQTLEKSP